METPKNLKHKPIIVVDDYDKIDAKFTNDKTDAQALSIGHAQYDKDELSVKIWRFAKTNRWSRQSEELPLHRLIDLSILTLYSLLKETEENKKFTSLEAIITEPNDVPQIKKYLEDNISLLEPKLKELKQILDDYFKDK